MPKSKGEVTPTPNPETRISANQLLKDFMIANNIVLVQPKLLDSIRTISDGSIIIDTPIVKAKYADE